MTTISDKLTSIYNAKKDIKSAITDKGKSVGDNILDYAAAIRSIEQGSGGSPVYRNWWKVYFIDYDGTVLSYQEVNNGDDFVFPDAPEHADKELVFTGWNQTSNHTSDYDPQDIYTIVIGALYDTVGNTKLMFNAHSLTMTTGFTLTSTVADGITIDWGDGTTTTSSSTSSTEYTHTYDRSYLGKDVTVEIQCADGNTYTFDKVKTGLDNIMPTNVKLGKGCTKISDNAFKDCYNLQSVNIPLSVTSIGGNAFSNCSSLQSVTIPSSVTSISNNVFQDCLSLQSITIPASARLISSNLLYNCYSLQSVSIPSSVAKNDNLLKNCYSIIYNNVICNPNNPNSVYNTNELETDKFIGVFVKSVTIPSSVTSISDSAFQNCYNLQSVNIPSSVTSIGDSAFQNCYSLQSITIPSGVTNISSNVFVNCYNLQSVNIPSGVTKISSNAFSGCNCLKSLTIPSSAKDIRNNAFYKCYSLQSINIPSGVTKIDNNTLAYCYSLQSITIPSSVTTIISSAFYYCYSLQSITIPSSVTKIDYGAFNYTNCILDFGNERTTVPTISSTSSIGSNFCIVPDALYETWCTATNWSTMTNKIIKYSDYHK